MMRRAFSAIYHAHQRHVFGNLFIEQPLMRLCLSRMALQLKGQNGVAVSSCASVDRRADAKEALWRVDPRLRKVSDPQTRVCRLWPSDGRCWAALVIARRAMWLYPGDAGKQYLARFPQYYVPGCVARSQ
ncbi:hypothetical protein ACNKHV_27225 [Shigella flexneri]